MILVDTSAWVEFDLATGSDVHRRLRSLIERDDASVAVTGPVVMEVLAGARSSRREQDLRDLLDRFVVLPFDPQVHFDVAVQVCQECRGVGVTPRGLVDCMIAAVALGADVPVLAHDRDFVRMAAVVGLELDTPGPA